MYPISQDVLKQFKSNAYQTAKITFSGVQDSMEISDSDIMMGGLVVDRYCTSGKSIEIGSAIAGELSLILNNYDGRFNNTVFEGAELYGQIGVEVSTGVSYVPLGYFTVDEAPRKLSTISLTALDRMVRFDKDVKPESLSFPMTVSNLASRICYLCNVTLGSDIQSLPNAAYMIPSMPEGDNLTYRQLVSWIAEITGTCAYIDWAGSLKFSWFVDTDTEIGPSGRYTSKLLENAITVTGVQVSDGENIYLSGTEGYVLNIDGNGLIQSDHASIVKNIGATVVGLTYTPFSASVIPIPHVYPLDKITFVDKSGNSVPTIVTSIRYVKNRPTDIQGKGETETNKGYASANPLTKRQAAIIETLERKQNEALAGYTQSLLDFNDLIANSMGMFVTSVPQENGSHIRYMHDQPTLENSQVIFTMTRNGVAWTNQGWNDGSPVWQYGTTGAGDAFFRIVRAMSITAGIIQSADGGNTFYADLDNGIIRIKSLQDALDGLDAALSAEVLSRVDANGTIMEQLTQLRQSASALSILIQDIQGNGVDKVITSMGYAFTNDGLDIQKPGEEIKNKIDNTGVFVSRDADLVLEASASGVNAPDVTIRDRLNLCERGLFEKYNNGKEVRIGLFIV